MEMFNSVFKDVSRLTKEDLQKELKKRNINTKGTKATLFLKLVEAMEEEQKKAKEKKTPPKGTKKSRRFTGPNGFLICS